jgi:hypothetical protein
MGLANHHAELLPLKPIVSRLVGQALCPKLPNHGISDAQKKALRIYASETQPQSTQNACAKWFASLFGRHINRSTVS